MATEFDPRRNIPPPEGAELTPEEKARQKIIEHLKDAELESPRFQAFADYADLQEQIGLQRKLNHLFKIDKVEVTGSPMIKETIRQRKNGRKGYKREYELVEDITEDYYEALFDRESEGRASQTINTNEPEVGAQFNFCQGLVDIKNQEIDEKSQ